MADVHLGFTDRVTARWGIKGTATASSCLRGPTVAVVDVAGESCVLSPLVTQSSAASRTDEHFIRAGHACGASAPRLEWARRVNMLCLTLGLP